MIAADLRALVEQLERNDVVSAEEVARLIVAREGVLPGEISHYLCMLQDDPDLLIERLSNLPVSTNKHAI